MKKQYSLLVILILFLTSCSLEDVTLKEKKDNDIADITFEKVISVINYQDNQQFIALFSKAVQEETTGLNENVINFMEILFHFLMLQRLESALMSILNIIEQKEKCNQLFILKQKNIHII